MNKTVIEALAEENNWRILDRRSQSGTTPHESTEWGRTYKKDAFGRHVYGYVPYATTTVESEVLTLLPNGNPIPKGTEGMTDAIRELANLGKAADEADEEDRDYGYELYVQHELNGGRESQYSGCTHPEGVYVVDGHKGRITTGNTLVWDFCTECGSMIGNGPSEFYSYLDIGLRHCTETYTKDAPSWDGHKEGDVVQWTEVVWWTIEKSIYGKPNHVYTVEEATPMIRRAINRR